LFHIFNREPDLLPSEWRDEATKRDAKGCARVIADYIAGMTDRFALDEHRRLVDPDATT